MEIKKVYIKRKISSRLSANLTRTDKKKLFAQVYSFAKLKNFQNAIFIHFPNLKYYYYQVYEKVSSLHPIASL